MKSNNELDAYIFNGSTSEPCIREYLRLPPVDAVRYLTDLFCDSDSRLHAFTNQQIDLGFSRLLRYPPIGLIASLVHSDVSENDAVRAILHIPDLYSDCFDARQGLVCAFGFFEAIYCAACPIRDCESLRHAIMQSIDSILIDCTSSDSFYGALHGLNHLATLEPAWAEATVQRFLGLHSDLSPQLAAYAVTAASGRHQ